MQRTFERIGIGMINTRQTPEEVGVGQRFGLNGAFQRRAVVLLRYNANRDRQLITLPCNGLDVLATFRLQGLSQ